MKPAKGWKPGLVSIRRNNRSMMRERTSGIRRGPWGIFEDLLGGLDNDGGWNLTHIPTGTTAGRFPSRAKAIRAADDLDELLDFSKVRSSLIGKPIAEKCKAITIKHGARTYAR